MAALSVWTGTLMIPASLLTSPFTPLAARRLRSGLLTTVAIGAAVGAAEVGVAYSGVVWWLCIRPRHDLRGGARWSVT